MNTILNKHSVLAFLLLSIIFVNAQSGLEKVMEQGQAHEDEGNYQQAKYYYGLVNRLASSKPHFSLMLQESSAVKVKTQDSLLAYRSKNSEIRVHMNRYDSLSICCNVVWQIVELERVVELNQNLVYPKRKINQLLKENPGITKQLLILQSKIRREAFLSNFKLEKKKMSEGKKLEGYFGLKSLVSEKHPNAELDAELLKLEKELEKEIVQYEMHLKAADSLLTVNELKLAKEEFNLALDLNSECEFCFSNLEMIDELSKMKKWTNVIYQEKLQEARSNAAAGELLSAKRNYKYILRNSPMDNAATNELLSVEEKLNEQQNYKQLKLGVQLQEERANSFFSKGEYAAALAIYEDLNNKYVDYSTNAELIEERILICRRNIIK